MKLPQLITRKKLRAMTARRAALGGAEMDYEEMSEPNMKLSRALLIVLVLHVVAVAGIVAFNTIKARQGPIPEVSTESTTAKPAPAGLAKTESSNVVAPARIDDAKVAKVQPKPVVVDEHKVEKAKPVETNSPAVAGKTYVVAKGDSPVSIARKFKVPFDDLMVANHIEDPTKLKIGQKLIIPSKTTKPKKADK
jgi:LysM repeat protein